MRFVGGVSVAIGEVNHPGSCTLNGWINLNGRTQSVLRSVDLPLQPQFGTFFVYEEFGGVFGSVYRMVDVSDHGADWGTHDQGQALHAEV